MFLFAIISYIFFWLETLFHESWLCNAAEDKETNDVNGWMDWRKLTENFKSVFGSKTLLITNSNGFRLKIIDGESGKVFASSQR